MRTRRKMRIIQMVKCEQCDQKFGSDFSLLRHWTAIHKDMNRLPSHLMNMLVEYESTARGQRGPVREKYGKSQAQMAKLKEIQERIGGGGSMVKLEPTPIAEEVQDHPPAAAAHSVMITEPSMRDAIGFLEMQREVYDRIIGDLRKLVRR